MQSAARWHSATKNSGSFIGISRGPAFVAGPLLIPVDRSHPLILQMVHYAYLEAPVSGRLAPFELGRSDPLAALAVDAGRE